MLVLLARRRLSAVSMRRGAEWLLADMLLFFVPAVLAVLNYPEFLGLTGLKILFVILASTIAVMVTTAFVVDRAYRWRADHGLASSDSLLNLWRTCCFGRLSRSASMASPNGSTASGRAGG